MQIYEAAGHLCAVTTKKTPLPIVQSTTYEQYLTMPLAPNVETIVPLNLSTAIGGQAASAMNGDTPDLNSTKGTTVASSAMAGRRMSITSRLRRRKGSSSNHSAPQAEEQPLGDGQPQVDSSGASTVRMQMSGTGRQVKARMWLTKDSPINQKQLLPLLDIVGSTNQYISKVLLAHACILASHCDTAQFSCSSGISTLPTLTSALDGWR